MTGTCDDLECSKFEAGGDYFNTMDGYQGGEEKFIYCKKI
jgi:hypothetical protein